MIEPYNKVELTADQRFELKVSNMVEMLVSMMAVLCVEEC